MILMYGCPEEYVDDETDECNCEECPLYIRGRCVYNIHYDVYFFGSTTAKNRMKMCIGGVTDD